jgi:hypothetical protein
MTLASPRPPSPQPAPADAPARTVARQLAVAGLGVKVSPRRETCELTVLGVTGGKSLMTLSPGGQARWYYEPAAGPATSPAALALIIAHLLGAPPGMVSVAAHRALPLKGQVGRALHDAGLTVTLRVSEDLDSFEATTSIDVTSPGRSQLGTITLSDDAAVDWRCDLWAAFGGNPAAWIDVIIPILCPR